MFQGYNKYVSPNGNDNDPGSKHRPYKTIQKAVAVSRQSNVSNRVIYLLEGTFYLTSPISLDHRDNGLSIKAYPKHKVVVSGAQRLDNLQWETFGKKKVKKALLSEAHKQVLSPLTRLYFEGVPGTRARFPNADSNTQGLHTNTGSKRRPKNTGYTKTNKWLQKRKARPKQVLKSGELRVGQTRYSRFIAATGGAGANMFSPSFSYWAHPAPVGGGGCTFQVPQGLQFKENSLKRLDSKTANNMFVHAFPKLHWANWIFSVKRMDVKKKTLYFNKGGFQEARGDCGTGGNEFFLENHLDLLDNENEYFVEFNKNGKASSVYYMRNESNPYNWGDSLVATTQLRLVEILGTASLPVKRVSIQGITFQHTQETHMEPHEVPSGGDCTVTRHAAIFAEGVEDLSIVNNHFQHLGGNGVFLSGYARRTSVSYNSFKWLGAGAILQVGHLLHDSPRPWDRRTDPNHPEGTLIQNNVASEIGLIVKQSSGLFSALTKSSLIKRNTFYNGARAGINFNDGFGGGHLVEGSVLFNLVRETSDHGPINVWDRQAYMQRHRGVDSNYPLPTKVESNFLYGGYGATKGIDLDDGTSFWEMTHNVVIHNIQKLKGRDNAAVENLFMFPPAKPFAYTVLVTVLVNTPSNMVFKKNTVVTKSAKIYWFEWAGTCGKNNFQTGDNTLMVESSSKFRATCYPKKRNKSLNFKAWVKMGHDAGTVIPGGFPTTEEQVSIMQGFIREHF